MRFCRASLCPGLLLSLFAVVACGESKEEPRDAALRDADGDDDDAGHEIDPEEDAGSEEDAEIDDGITYHKDIRPLIESNCLQCHIEGGIGPMRLDRVDEVMQFRALIVAAIEAGIMPPWPASADCRDLKDVRALGEEEVALFAQWRDNAYAIGEASDYRAEAVDAPVDLGEPDILLKPADSYLPNTAIIDEYRCFVAEGTFEKDTYLTAMDIRPGVRGEVHHVQVHKIPESQLEIAQGLDDAAEGSGYPCVGGAGAGISSVNMFSWRPGTAVVAFEAGDAALVEAGSAFVLQVHYNNQFLPEGEEPQPDQSAVAFWTLPDGELPERVVVRTGFFAPVGPSASGFGGVIPAGEPHVIGTRSATLMQLSVVKNQFVAGEIIGMTPHMHTLGTRLSATMDRADGSSQCMIDVPEWDFEWQLDYSYMSPEPYGPDDLITVTCEYDNSAANQPLLNGEQLAPRDVGWGEGSLDEMCLNYIWFRYPRDEFLAANTQ